MRTYRIQGGEVAFHARLGRLFAPTPPSQPSTLPTPSAAHFRAVAARKRREAASIARDLPTSGVETIHARFNRRLIDQLYHEAGIFDRLALAAQDRSHDD